MADYHAFPNTHWSLVKRAGLPDQSARSEALQTILHRYLPALRSYLRVARRLSEEESEELLQSFITEKILEHDLIGQADQTKGRFRSLLLVSLKNYHVSRIRSQKRANASAFADYDHEDDAPTSELLVQGVWARALIHRVIESMKAECQNTGRQDIWLVFEERILLQIFGNAKPESYESLALRLKLTSPTQAANLLVTAKRMYVRLMRAAVAEYEADPLDIDNEILDLWRILASSPAFNDD